MFNHAFARLPTIYVTARDRDRLTALLARRTRYIPAFVRISLERELTRAVICADGAIPPDVVTMNSRAVYRADLGTGPQSRTLIYDDDHAILGGTISIASAAGAALLGLREGSRMPYDTVDGERRMLVLDRVAYQPEAQGRSGDDPYRRWPAGPTATVIDLPLRKRPPRSEGPPDEPGPGAA